MTVLVEGLSQPTVFYDFQVFLEIDVTFVKGQLPRKSETNCFQQVQKRTADRGTQVKVGRGETSSKTFSIDRWDKKGQQ
ncbi:hypothetical protein E4U19_006431, partial [Claviceps sp. Clav32 group G5]